MLGPRINRELWQMLDERIHIAGSIAAIGELVGVERGEGEDLRAFAARVYHAVKAKLEEISPLVDPRGHD